MQSYATIVSTSTRSSGKRWCIIPEINENAPVAPKIDGMAQETKQEPLRIQRKNGEENGSGYVPRKAYIASKLDAEVRMFTKENLEHTKWLKVAARKIRNAIKTFAPDAKVFMVGSYAAGVEIHSSDLDFSVIFEGKVDPQEKLAELADALRAHESYVKVKLIRGATVPVLKVFDYWTDVEIDITVGNDNGMRNTQLLAYYTQMDERFAPLCKAVKYWAAFTGVENARRGRLNSFTLCMMVIHFLQVIGILPCIQKYKRNLRGDCVVEDDQYMERGRKLREELEEKGKFAFGANTADLGVLYGGFMKYFAEFDFRNKWISIRKGIALEKRYSPEDKPIGGLPDRNHRLIVVEDPFLKKPFNCARTLYAGEYLQRITLEFQECYERIEATGSIFSIQRSEARRMLDLEAEEGDKSMEIAYKIAHQIKWAPIINLPNDQWESAGSGDVAVVKKRYQIYQFNNSADVFWDRDNKIATAFRKKTSRGPEWPLATYFPDWL